MAPYADYFSASFRSFLLSQSQAVAGVEGLRQIGASGGLESTESFRFLVALYERVSPRLDALLRQRKKDRAFLDERTRALYERNRAEGYSVDDPRYLTVLGLEDADGRIVMGPRQKDYWQKTTHADIAPLPDYLRGNHVTLFGPPDNAKMCVNAMNAFHRRLKGEPAIVEELLAQSAMTPKWGADDEDSKTPLREDLISAGENLSHCFSGDIAFQDPSGARYELKAEKLSLPIKRFPGLALPCSFLFYRDEPLPLHLYDFALHLFKNWERPEALVFYVPKIENEEEAAYFKFMFEEAEKLLQKKHAAYRLGTLRVMIVLENPRAVFRAHEIMDELHPYFAGASLGWHDFLASTARLFREDGNYRIPIKADPDIVIKYIKASHELLARVVGPRGGVKVGGMYGILPLTNDLQTDSFQLTIKGYIRDVVTQMKRKLSGFWVAHPDFVRLGIAMIEAWKLHETGNSEPLRTLICSLLQPRYHEEILNFVFGPDIESLDPSDPRYARSLIVADLKQSALRANADREEIRYNVFQSLQYLTDWLSGNGCVALPANIGGVPVRVMDDLATAERSRWEVWHEIRHGRVSLEDFLVIAHEEMNFIRRDLSDEKKIVQVKWNEQSQKWYPIAFKLMVKLMCEPEPVEFATELLLPFTLDAVRNAPDPWAVLEKAYPEKFHLPERAGAFHYYFERCGNKEWARQMAALPFLDLTAAKNLMLRFRREDVIEAAAFHGDIGQAAATLDATAAGEQAKVVGEAQAVKDELLALGKIYREKFGVKFLVSAKGKSAAEMLTLLRQRLQNTEEEELKNGIQALWEITEKRLVGEARDHFWSEVEKLRVKHGVQAAQLSVASPAGCIQIKALGDGVSDQSYFEMASLSKSVGSAFAMEYFRKKGISLSTPVNFLLQKSSSRFRIQSAEGKPAEWAEQVTLAHLMSHGALNMHYVFGVPANQKMPPIVDFLEGNAQFGYPPIRVIVEPGRDFRYSGGGFVVLEHLIEALEGKSIFALTRPFLDALGMQNFSFEQGDLPGKVYAHGFRDDGSTVEGGRKMFPAFAAGAMGTTEAMLRFLQRLETAFHSLSGTSVLSHDTAVQMLHGQDLGSMDFMGAKMGLGIFTAEAGPNRFAIHQGANDGFRCLFLYCYTGPDRGRGFVLCCNGEMKGVQFISEVAQLYLSQQNIVGIDPEKFQSLFRHGEVKEEEKVNRGYKELVFRSFLPDLPEPIPRRGPLDPLSAYNRVVGARVLGCGNQKFARAENLIHPSRPVFEPDLFGAQGKVMDSWESARHSPKESEDLVLELVAPSEVHFVSFSTEYHLGNQVPKVSLEGLEAGKSTDLNWIEIIPPSALEGHAIKYFRSKNTKLRWSHLRVRTYPDGGLSRLGVYGADLPLAEQARFSEQGRSEKWKHAIPTTRKPLTLSQERSSDEIAAAWKKIHPGEEVNVASSALGAKIVSVTSQHYGPAAQVISPFPALHMFDGFESARSRVPGHREEIVVELARPSKLSRLEFDFTYFVNNNPKALQVEALTETGWIEIVPLSEVKAFAANQKEFLVHSPAEISQVRIKVFPDGGINRVRVFSRRET